MKTFLLSLSLLVVLAAPLQAAYAERFELDMQNVDIGEFIDTGKPIADIINIKRIKINVRVPELDIRFVLQGQKTPVRIDAFPDRTLSGTVDFVAFKADPATKTFLVRTVIENPFGDIRPGMIARVAFVRRVIPDALLAPLLRWWTKVASG